jgi:hypothetical protein
MKLTITQITKFKCDYHSRFALAAAILGIGNRDPKKRFSSIFFKYHNPDGCVRMLKVTPPTDDKVLVAATVFPQICEEICKCDDIDPEADIELIFNLV